MHTNKHGLSHFKISGHVVIHTAEGAWNLPTAHEFGDEIKRLVVQELPPYWVLLSDVRFWEYCTPEVWSYFDELYIWAAEQ